MTKDIDPKHIVAGSEQRGSARPSQRPDDIHPEQRLEDDSWDKLERRKRGEDKDEFYIPPECIPDGWSVEWKRFRCIGMDDQAHINGLEMDGWRAAKPKDFPMLCGPSYKESVIQIKDLRLYVRPERLTNEARGETKARANKQVLEKMQEIGLAKPGTAPRTDGYGRPLANVKRTYGAKQEVED